MTDEQIIQRVLARGGKMPGHNRLRKEFNIGYSRAKRLKREIETIRGAMVSDAPLVETTETPDGLTVTATGQRIITPEQLIELSGVDLQIWRPARPVVKKWDVVTKDADGNPVITEAFAVKVGFIARPGGEMLKTLFSDVLADIRSHAPVYPKISQMAAFYSSSPSQIHISAN